MAGLKFLKPFKFFKSYIPRSLYGRVLLILVAPLFLATTLTTYIFFEHHLGTITRRLANDIAGEVASILELKENNIMTPSQVKIFALDNYDFEMREINKSNYIPRGMNQNPVRAIGSLFLEKALAKYISYPFEVAINSDTIFMDVFIDDDRVMLFETNRKRLLSKTTPVYLMWMTGLPILFFIIAALFMRNQVRPIRKLARQADKFGKGLASDPMKAEGATEIRQAMVAFNRMHERIQRQITQRTEMLAGVSHDLRTPLTRMELQLALLEETSEIEALKADVKEMRKMVESYLAFARGEKEEETVMTNIYDLIQAIAGSLQAKISMPERSSIRRSVKPISLKRCFQNILVNADRYASVIDINLSHNGDDIQIEINDNGPGIPEEKRAEVFKPFYRLDTSRNLDYGGVGLGLSIARDIVHQHGGTIVLGDSNLGGLSVKITLPG